MNALSSTLEDRDGSEARMLRLIEIHCPKFMKLGGPLMKDAKAWDEGRARTAHGAHPPGTQAKVDAMLKEGVVSQIEVARLCGVSETYVHRRVRALRS